MGRIPGIFMMVVALLAAASCSMDDTSGSGGTDTPSVSGIEFKDRKAEMNEG